MHLSRTLCLLAVVSATTAAPKPSPFKLPWQDGVSCKPWNEDGVDKTWSMQFYESPNCADRIKRIDSKSDDYEVNKCYLISSKVRSFHGIGHSKYTVKWFKDKTCTKVFKKSEYGNLQTESKLSAKKAPKSFMVQVPKDHGPWPRYASCGKTSGSDTDSKKQERTHAACELIWINCQNTKTEYKCPSPGKFYKTFGSGDERCRIHTYQMQKWFDHYCEGNSGASCVRQIKSAGDTHGKNGIDVPCGSSRRTKDD